MPSRRHSHSRTPVAINPTPGIDRDVSSAWRIDSLTALRGLAAFAVFAFHAWLLAHMPDPAPGVALLSPALTWLMRNGWSGVDVFFTLSAFLLAMPYARAAVAGRPPPDWRAYLRRRAARILPAYWVQLAIVLAGSLMGVAWGRTFPAWEGVGSALAHVVLWINAWPRVAALQPHWWTLPVEFGFYLMLPCLARAFTARRWPWLLALVALAWAWRAAWLMNPRADFAHFAWIEQLPGRIDQFAIGMLAAWWWARREGRGGTISPRRANTLLVAGALAFLAMPALFLVDGRATLSQVMSLHPVVLAWHGLASAAVALVLVACAAGAPAARWLAARPLRFLGEISYSLYLWHVPVIFWVLWQSGDTIAVGDFWPYFSICLLLSLALASLSWWGVERPALRWAARRREVAAIN
ncbi:MAG: acyltransferase family protein [Arenimonas sp.]